MYKLKISPEAKNDLAEIKGYISQELCNPQAAVNLVSKITKKIRGLSEYPEIGAPLSSVVDIHSDRLSFPCLCQLPDILQVRRWNCFRVENLIRKAGLYAYSVR
jgi:plasmid stabilization system protein ParE